MSDQSNKQIPDILPRAESGKRLTNKQLAFVHNYIDPESDTYGNATRSARAAGYTGVSVPSTACETRKLPHVETYIADLLEQNGLGDNVRIGLLAKIARGEDTKRVRSTTTYRDGSEVVTETEQPTAHKDQLRAIDVANKMVGIYDANRARADVASSEARAVMRRWRNLLDNDTNGGTPDNSGNAN
jgi:phage terminase small subunit